MVWLSERCGREEQHQPTVADKHISTKPNATCHSSDFPFFILQNPINSHHNTPHTNTRTLLWNHRIGNANLNLVEEGDGCNFFLVFIHPPIPNQWSPPSQSHSFSSSFPHFLQVFLFILPTLVDWDTQRMNFS